MTHELTSARRHPLRPGRGGSGAFALVELAATVAVTVGVTCVILALAHEGRRQARLGDDIAKLKRFGEATGAYAADNSDLFWTFSWKKGYNLSPYPDLNAQAQSSDQQAASAQAVYLLRTKAGREDIIPISSWLPHQYYSHFALLAHFGSPWPDLWAVSSADKRRTAWARNPKGFDAGLYLPAPTPIGTNDKKRWPYSSNFITSTAFYDGSQPDDSIYQTSSHNLYQVPVNAAFGARTLSGVAFPSM